MSDAGEKLSFLLQCAADETEDAAETFFIELLKGKVFVAVDPNAEAPKDPILVGEGRRHLKQSGYMVVSYEGSLTLPIFTEESFVGDWLDTQCVITEVEFSKLLWYLGAEDWLYINPGQELGKEITPWEIEQLRRGPEGIPDLVEALKEEFDEELTVENNPENLGKLRSKLLPLLELYPELIEAFLVTIREGEKGDEKPTLGLRYRRITDAKRMYLRSEFDNLSKEHLPGHQQLFLVDDLGEPNSPNIRLFEGATPIYIGPAAAHAEPTESLMEKAKSRMMRMFTKNPVIPTVVPEPMDEVDFGLDDDDEIEAADDRDEDF